MTDHPLSRRQFIRLAALTGLLAGCRSAVRQVAVTATPAPLPAAARLSLADAPGKVVQAQHSGVWSEEETLAPQALQELLDGAITSLTGITDARQAWSALFDPGERIAIKVNTVTNSDYPTHLPLVLAVTEQLQEVGVPAEQIVIYDRGTLDLELADYPVNHDGSGVRCYGNDENYAPDWTIMGDEAPISEVLLSCDALINMPILKDHVYCQMTFAMKNHYGTLHRPSRFHRPRITTALGELSALSPIRDRTRLIIGDVLRIVRPGWTSAWQGDSLLMSYDPVAHDSVGLQLLNEAIASSDVTVFINDHASEWLQHAADLGVGTNDPAQIQWTRTTVG
jgi:hypothetical protein